MTNEFWLGSEASLMDLVQTERTIQANFVDMLDRRKAFMSEYEGSEMEPRKGQYLLEVHENGVATIKVSGSLTNNYKWYHEYLDGQVTSYEAIGDALELAIEDESINKITLVIASGGGAVTGIDALGERIRRADNVKPVIAYTETAAFSAAYWIAASARKVYASRMAEVGSIGTLLVHQSIAKMAEQAGVTFTIFRAGKYKAMGLPYEELTDEVKEYIQADLEEANGFFLEHVSLRRSLMMSEKHRWAEGRTFFAGKAQDVGLIDGVATLEEVVSAVGAYQPRRNRMFISDAKRAQIAAGAEPKDVLTAEELKQYNAELADQEEDSGEDEGVIAEEKLARITAGEKPEDVLTAEELTQYRADNPESDDPEPEPSVGGGGDLSKEYHQALRDNGKLEAKLEAEQAKAQASQDRLDALQAQTNSLLEVGKLAVHNLQVALGKPKETPQTAEALLASYNELQGQMASRFATSRQSSSESESGEEEHAQSLPLAFRQQPSK